MRFEEIEKKTQHQPWGDLLKIAFKIIFLGKHSPEKKNIQ